jgi:hypothetical protein
MLFLALILGGMFGLAAMLFWSECEYAKMWREECEKAWRQNTKDIDEIGRLTRALARLPRKEP